MASIKCTAKCSPSGGLRTLVGLVALAAAAGQLQAADTRAESGKSFIDDFERLDEERWYVSDGWSNGALQSCLWRRRNLELSRGALLFHLKREDDAKTASSAPDAPSIEGKAPKKWEGFVYSCAEIRTKQRFGYGYYEARLRPVDSAGTVSAFFTYIGPGTDKRMPHDEIDFEILGKDPRQVQLNFHQNGKGGNESKVEFGYNASGRTADLAFEWRPDILRWYIDGRVVREAVSEPGKKLPSEPAPIFFSLWSGTGANMEAWLGKFEETKLPLEMSVDYVAFTALDAPCQFPASVACKDSSP